MPTSIEIIKKLRKAGFEAYWAGGCVRDILLGVKPKDFDIVTSAKPEEIETTLEHTIPIGKQFGVILTIADGHHFEVATFRSDSSYSDGRRPDAVLFTNAEEDAKRRDFTINGMFYDPIEDKILDYIDGQKDLENRLIRFIGKPAERLMEDHLRILRAVRFKNVLDFQYDPETYQALQKHASLLIDKVSAERIRDELNKMIISPHAANAFQDMEDLGILKILLPEVQKMKGVAQPYKYHQEGDVWTHAMHSLASLPEESSLALRWATLLHDIGKPETFSVKERIRFDSHDRKSAEIAGKILNALHFERKTIDEVCWLVEHHMMVDSLLKMPEGRKRHWFLHPYFKNLVQLFEADVKGTTPSDMDYVDQIKRQYLFFVRHTPKLPDPLVDGDEVMGIFGLKPSKKVAFILQKVREKQLTKELRTKKQALEWLRKFKHEMN